MLFSSITFIFIFLPATIALNLIVPEQMGIRTLLFDDEARDFPRFLAQLEAALAR